MNRGCLDHCSRLYRPAERNFEAIDRLIHEFLGENKDPDAPPATYGQEVRGKQNDSIMYLAIHVWSRGGFGGTHRSNPRSLGVFRRVDSVKYFKICILSCGVLPPTPDHRKLRSLEFEDLGPHTLPLSRSSLITALAHSLGRFSQQ